MTRTVELILALKTETSAAYLVYDGEEADAVWLPKSQVEQGRSIGQDGMNSVYEFIVPEWLAQDKGLI